MARLNINVGTNANDGTGDDLRTAMQKINTNFTELYAETLVDSGISISGNTISSNRSDDDIVFEPAGTGAVRFPAILINDNSITGTRSNEDLTIAASGTGNLILGSLRVNGTTISSDDSSKITLAENVDITGTLTAAVFQVNELSSSDSSAIQVNDGLNVSGTFSADSIDINEISSSDSSAIQVNDNMNVLGTLVANSFVTNTIISTESSAIQVVDGLNVSGDLTTAGTLTAVTVITNEISSADSTAIQVNDAVNISGELTANSTLVANGAITANGILTANTIVTNDIESSDSTAIQINDSVNISGTLSVNLLDVNEVSSGDSAAIQVNDALNVSGTLTANTFVTNAISSSESSAIQINDDANVLGTLTANNLVASGIEFPSTDGTAGQFLITNGAGTLSFTTGSTSAAGSNGQIQFNTGGNLDASANFTIDGTTLNAANIRVSGDLTVDGEQTIVNTTVLSVEDNIIELNRNVSENSQMPTYSGIKISRGELSTATEQDVYWVWDESFADDGTTGYTYGAAGGAWTALRSADGNTDSGPNQIDPTDAALVDVRCRIVNAVATSANYADLAELYLADADYPVGTVVCIGGAKEVTAASYGDAAIGVVSAQPAFLMNRTLQGGTVIALKGRVPVLVQGTVKKGDKLIPTQNMQGAASAADRSSADYFAIALQDHQSGSGTIECLVL